VDQTGKDPKIHIEKERTRIEAPSYAMSARNQDNSSQNIQTLIRQITRYLKPMDKKVLMST